MGRSVGSSIENDYEKIAKDALQVDILGLLKQLAVILHYYWFLDFLKEGITILLREPLFSSWY